MNKEYEFIGEVLVSTKGRVEEHQVFDAGFRRGATLHRFLNPAGVEYSAIYIDGEEVWSIDRSGEGRMVSRWRERERW